MATAQNALPKKTNIRNLEDILGPSRDVAEINARLEWAAQHCNLIAPASSIVHVPQFHAISFTVARIGERDYYCPDSRKGNYAFNKRGVTIIAGEANISWHPGFTRRVDDGQNPRYCEAIATAVYFNFDSTVRTVPATKSCDLTDGSDEVDQIFLEADSPQKAEARLRNKRHFIREHVDSGAKVRAMKDCQVKDYYSREEIGRPFVVAKLVRTGQSDDPELQREYALMQAELALKAASALFGGELDLSTARTAGVARPASPQTPAPEASGQTATATARAVNNTRATNEVVAATQSTTATPDPTARARAASQSVPDSAVINPADFKVPFGRTRGTPLPDATDKDLAFLTIYYTDAIGNPDKAAYRELNEHALKAVLIVKQRRSAAERKNEE